MRFGNSVYMLFADAVETIDVNYPDEFELADMIMRGKIEKENAEFNLLTKFINSAIISDILSDMGIESTIAGLQLNLPNKRIMGRANTLKIRALKDGEDYKGIYDGLKTYERVTPGEIIVVENEVSNRAYFGELNANLAVRACAKGTIVGGVTRDIEAVNMLDYPVFSRGYCCADVKGYATVEEHQTRIEIDGVCIEPGDIIVADMCGVVCIPKKYEKVVLEKAIAVVETEKNILKRVLKNENAVSIYEQEGEF